MTIGTWTLIAAAAVVLVWFLPGVGLAALTRRWRAVRERSEFEDALKHLLAFAQRGQQATPNSLAGALGLSQKRLVRLIERMETRCVIKSVESRLRLTSSGERWALQIVRAHRLWERYLADEAGVPMSKLHGAAERAEHSLTSEKLEEIEAHLGYPLHDPHGDPIPRANGFLAPAPGVPLTDWPPGEPAQIVHVEDEPEIVLKQILASGLLPGVRIRPLESRPDCLVISDGEHEHRLAPVVAANIHVVTPKPAPKELEGVTTLADLPDGEEASVVTIDSQYRGFGRRRLLDLGLTPGATIRVELSNAFGDPRAFRVRGTVIALRRDQAAQVWVRPQARQAIPAGRAGAASG